MIAIKLLMDTLLTCNQRCCREARGDNYKWSKKYIKLLQRQCEPSQIISVTDHQPGVGTNEQYSCSCVNIVS